jgi:hypothetical protein
MNELTNEDGDIVDRFLAAEGRVRKSLLAEVLEGADEARLRRLAPVLKDPSPKVGARLTSALARAELDEVFLKAIEGVKPARAEQLRNQFKRIAGRPARGTEEVSDFDFEGDDKPRYFRR